jgi:hypothetical protein
VLLFLKSLMGSTLLLLSIAFFLCSSATNRMLFLVLLCLDLSCCICIEAIANDAAELDAGGGGNGATGSGFVGELPPELASMTGLSRSCSGKKSSNRS